MRFDLYVGIDYSGAQTPESRLKALQVYAAGPGKAPEKIPPPSSPRSGARNWSRREIARWITELGAGGERFIAGIDHCFSFPLAYFRRYGLESWEEFLDDFVRHWPTHEPYTYVDFLLEEPPDRMGDPGDLRLAERWTQGASSVFRMRGAGSVGKASFAGIPWLRFIREETRNHVYVWPFDGWELPAEAPVLVEAYPALCRRRYPWEGRTADEHDAFSVAAWLRDMDSRGALERYTRPPLSESEKRVAELEGWIFGVI
jgi:hypothetical protein